MPSPPASTPVPTPTFDPGRAILPTVAIPTRTPTPAQKDVAAETMDSIGSRVSILRGIFAIKPVERRFIDRDDLEAGLRADLEDDREEVNDYQKLLIAMGLLSDGDDLFELIVELRSEQVIGYFDTEDKQLYIVGDGSEFGPYDQMTYAHEFTHALQQDRFDIHSLIDSAESNSDASRAVAALVEGDATLVQTIYVFQHVDQEEQQAIAQAVRSGPQDVFDSAPYVLQRTTTFPYLVGPAFVFALYSSENDWAPVNRAYELLPISTEQILHPEKYLAGERPVAVELPDVAGALGGGWSVLDEDTLGELLLGIYLETGADQEVAAEAAAGWGGDRYALLSGPGDATLLASLVVWDTEEDAAEFHQTFLDHMRNQTGQEWEAPDAEGGDHLMALPGRTVLLRLDGDRTLLVVAPDVGLAQAAGDAFPKE